MNTLLSAMGQLLRRASESRIFSLSLKLLVTTSINLLLSNNCFVYLIGDASILQAACLLLCIVLLCESSYSKQFLFDKLKQKRLAVFICA